MYDGKISIEVPRMFQTLVNILSTSLIKITKNIDKNNEIQRLSELEIINMNNMNNMNARK